MVNGVVRRPGGHSPALALLLHLQVTEAAAGLRVARRRELVEEFRRRILRRLQRELGRRAADDRQVVRRAVRGAEQTDLLLQEGHDLVGVQDRLGLLVEVRLVGRPAALGHEQELVGVLVALDRVGVQLDLGRQVAAGVLLLEERHRRIV